MLPKQTIIKRIFVPGAGTICGPFAIKHEIDNLHLPMLEETCGKWTYPKLE